MGNVKMLFYRLLRVEGLILINKTTKQQCEHAAHSPCTTSHHFYHRYYAQWVLAWGAFELTLITRSISIFWTASFLLLYSRLKQEEWWTKYKNVDALRVLNLLHVGDLQRGRWLQFVSSRTALSRHLHNKMLNCEQINMWNAPPYFGRLSLVSSFHFCSVSGNYLFCLNFGFFHSVHTGWKISVLYFNINILIKFVPLRASCTSWVAFFSASFNWFIYDMNNMHTWSQWWAWKMIDTITTHIW